MEFITPNWHVILIHYPLALLTIGTILELGTLLWSKEGLRTTGRWLLLIGTLLTIPAATSGLYAFRDVVAPAAAQVHLTPWYAVVAQSPWHEGQWEYMERHIWLNTSATVCYLAVVVAWIVSPGLRRQRLYWPLAALMVIGLGLLLSGAWYGGELVFRYGTAIEGVAAQHDPQEPDLARIHERLSDDAPAPPRAVGGNPEEAAAACAGGAKRPAELTYFLPPLQLHIVLAGITVALVVGTLSLAGRHWCEALEAAHSDEHTAHQHRTRRRLWWMVFAMALLTAGAGDWATLSSLGDDPVEKNLALLKQPDHVRLILHVIVGLGIVLVPLVFAVALHFRRERKFWTTAGVLLVLIAVPVQIWLGVMMLYDSREGSLWGFNAAPPAQRAEQDARPAAAVVRMNDEMEFRPAQVKVRLGETVEWRNHPSTMMHTVTADPARAEDRANVTLPKGAEPFDSGEIVPGGAFRHTFTVRGTYKYVCRPHEKAGMVGEVTVE